MRHVTNGILLDTHVWLWLGTGDSQLSIKSQKLIDETHSKKQLFVSAISIWEIAMLHAKERIDLGKSTIIWVKEALQTAGINLIHLLPEIAVLSCELPDHFHGDPADRILIATAKHQNLTLLTKDEKILQYHKFVDVLSA